MRTTRLVTEGDLDTGAELEMFLEKQYIFIAVVALWFA